MNHTICQGECLSSVAHRYGFRWQFLWDHAENAELKEKRKDPNVLYPGDILFIPEKRQQEVSRPTEKAHSFILKGTPTKLKLRLLKNGKARDGVDYILNVDGQTMKGRTDGSGRLGVGIPSDARYARLVIVPGAEEYQLLLGELDPLEEGSGVWSRLKSLGFTAGEPGDLESPQGSLPMEAALKRFQKSQKLSITGILDDKTRAALKRDYEG